MRTAPPIDTGNGAQKGQITPRFGGLAGDMGIKRRSPCGDPYRP